MWLLLGNSKHLLGKDLKYFRFLVLHFHGNLQMTDSKSLQPSFRNPASYNSHNAAIFFFSLKPPCLVNTSFKVMEPVCNTI